MNQPPNVNCGVVLALDPQAGVEPFFFGVGQVVVADFAQIAQINDCGTLEPGLCSSDGSYPFTGLLIGQDTDEPTIFELSLVKIEAEFHRSLLEQARHESNVQPSD